MRKISVAAAVALLASVGNAYAAGYQLNEFSVTNLGRSFRCKRSFHKWQRR